MSVFGRDVRVVMTVVDVGAPSPPKRGFVTGLFPREEVLVPFVRESPSLSRISSQTLVPHTGRDWT